MCFKDPSSAINIIIDNDAQKVMENNQKVIELLLKIVMLCEKQGLAL